MSSETLKETSLVDQQIHLVNESANLQGVACRGVVKQSRHADATFEKGGSC
jgi:hypothetical protein